MDSRTTVTNCKQNEIYNIYFANLNKGHDVVDDDDDNDDDGITENKYKKQVLHTSQVKNPIWKHDF